ncbi:MAG: dihydroneopterin aldolase [Chloroflexota bacterium]|jgi:dihydroneopterin aldolase
MTDRIVLENMQFQGRHGVHPEERAEPQPFEVDVELALDLAAAGSTDDLARTVDYSAVYDVCRRIVETGSYQLLEAIAETIATEVLADYPVDEVVVRVRKPAVRLGGPLRHAGVEIRRRAASGGAR